MKKFVLAAALVGAVSAASAADVGLRVGHSDGTEVRQVGVSLNTKVMGVNTEVAVDRKTYGDNNMTRLAGLGVLDLANVKGVTVSTKVGVAYVAQDVGQHGYAAVVGLGASYPVMKNAKVFADLEYQRGETGVRHYNGFIPYVGVKYSF